MTPLTHVLSVTELETPSAVSRPKCTSPAPHLQKELGAGHHCSAAKVCIDCRVISSSPVQQPKLLFGDGEQLRIALSAWNFVNEVSGRGHVLALSYCIILSKASLGGGA